MNAIQKIAAQLDEQFKSFDDTILADTREWALEKSAELKQYEATEEATKLRRSNVWAYYPIVHGMAGGKLWYNILRGAEKNILSFVEKNHEAKIKQRNHKIAAKLQKEGISNLVTDSIPFARSADGFEGTFSMECETANGTTFKKVHIQAIYAGGYNIQCFHMRVLVKVLK